MAPPRLHGLVSRALFCFEEQGGKELIYRLLSQGEGEDKKIFPLFLSPGHRVEKSIKKQLQQQMQAQKRAVEQKDKK